LFQDIALAIWRALPAFRDECSERTWAFRIAHNRGMSYLARHRLPTVDPEQAFEPADASPGPEQLLSRHEQRRRLLAAIRALPVNHRQVMTLADVLGISESNVGARLTRARDALRRLLNQRHPRGT
jgi:RNA polymerase sigma factor (sigma-70 family)